MCEYADCKSGKCFINNNICPYIYFCYKTNSYKANRFMPENCKIKERKDIPKGYYKVCFEKRGKLYVSIDNKIQIFSNPFDHVPSFVKIFKLKNGNFKMKEYKE